MSAAAGEGLSVHVDLPGRLRARVHAAPGEVVAVLGPNGSGKSTLLGAVTGTVPAVSVVLEGRDVTTAPVHQRRVGHLAQDVALFPHLSVLENVAFGPRATGTPRGRARTLAREVLARVGVADLADRRATELSGGQAQRVALARALATRPRVLLLDEPFASLDVGVATALRIELARHLASYDGVTLLVTHHPLDALTLADRVVGLEDGRVAQEGAPDDVAARPATAHVARLAGLNVVDEGPDRLTFRPTDVTVTLAEPEGSARHHWHGHVTAATPHGDAVRLLVDAGPTLLADVTPAAATELGLAPGCPVWLSVKATAVQRHPAVGDARRDR